MDIGHPGRYITFQLSGKYFAMPAERIREMMPMQPVVPLSTEAGRGRREPTVSQEQLRRPPLPACSTEAQRDRPCDPQRTQEHSFCESSSNALGAVMSRGRWIPIFDLRTQLLLKERHSTRQESLIIVQSHDQYEFGFPVDKLTDIIQVHAHEIRNDSIIGHGRIRTIIDLDALVDQERLFAAAFSRISCSSA
jgi:chemotaxis signal transduction protein